MMRIDFVADLRARHELCNCAELAIGPVLSTLHVGLCASLARSFTTQRKAQFARLTRLVIARASARFLEPEEQIDAEA